MMIGRRRRGGGRARETKTRVLHGRAGKGGAVIVEVHIHDEVDARLSGWRPLGNGARRRLSNGSRAASSASGVGPVPVS